MDIKDIKNWFEIAIPEPTIEQACIQIGCHYEEVAEMADALYDPTLSEETDRVANQYKDVEKYYIASLDSLDAIEKIEILDSLCDQIVTAIGVAHMLGMDIGSALNEVNRSNYSKFEDGKPVFNSQGKISKGVNYTPPDLTSFI